jgi:hypothetical protein
MPSRVTAADSIHGRSGTWWLSRRCERASAGTAARRVTVSGAVAGPEPERVCAWVEECCRWCSSLPESSPASGA